jgi:hypothetical protein
VDLPGPQAEYLPPPANFHFCQALAYLQRFRIVRQCRDLLDNITLQLAHCVVDTFENVHKARPDISKGGIEHLTLTFAVSAIINSSFEAVLHQPVHRCRAGIERHSLHSNCSAPFNERLPFGIEFTRLTMFHMHPILTINDEW